MVSHGGWFGEEYLYRMYNEINTPIVSLFQILFSFRWCLNLWSFSQLQVLYSTKFGSGFRVLMHFHDTLSKLFVFKPNLLISLNSWLCYSSILLRLPPNSSSALCYVLQKNLSQVGRSSSSILFRNWIFVCNCEVNNQVFPLTVIGNVCPHLHHNRVCMRKCYEKVSI